MTIFAQMLDMASTPGCSIAIWRDGEIYIEPATACPFSGPKADPRN
jgi:hypothetical protein